METIARIMNMAQALGYGSEVRISVPGYGGYKVKVEDGTEASSVSLEAACQEAHDKIKARVLTRISDYGASLKQLQDAIQE